MVLVVSINPFDFPVRARSLRLQRRSYFWHMAALCTGLFAVVVSFGGAMITPHVEWITRITTWSLILASLLLYNASRMSMNATYDRHPKWALIRLAYRRLPTLVRFRLDLDAPESTYRAYRFLRWRTLWEPPTLVTAINVNGISPGDILSLGPLRISYEEAVERFLHQCGNHPAL